MRANGRCGGGEVNWRCRNVQTCERSFLLSQKGEKDELMHKFRRDVDQKPQVLVQSISPGLVTRMPVLLRVLSIAATAAVL